MVKISYTVPSRDNRRIVFFYPNFIARPGEHVEAPILITYLEPGWRVSGWSVRGSKDCHFTVNKLGMVSGEIAPSDSSYRIYVHLVRAITYSAGIRKPTFACPFDGELMQDEHGGYYICERNTGHYIVCSGQWVDGVRINTDLIYVPEEREAINRTADYIKRQTLAMYGVTEESVPTKDVEREPDSPIKMWKMYREQFIDADNEIDSDFAYRHMLGNVQLGVEGYDVYDNKDPKLELTIDRAIEIREEAMRKALASAYRRQTLTGTLCIVLIGIIIILACCL